MVMAPATRAWTVADLESLPDDGNRYEVVRGQLLVTPSPSFGHQSLVSRIHILLGNYLDRDGMARAFVAPGDVRFGRRDQVQPDVFAIPVTSVTPDITWYNAPKPIIVIEVLSNSTRRRDLGVKHDLYMARGIPEYWIVDGPSREVTVCRPGEADRVERETLVWHPAGASEPLVVRLPALFEKALGSHDTRS